MIDRYSRKEISDIWTLENKFKIWLDIEIAACEANAQLGIIPQEDLKIIKEKAQFTDGTITQLGSDVLDIGVNAVNPVAQVKPNLTTEELVAIFSGKIKTWKELDPALPDRSIVVAVRDLGGGASEVRSQAQRYRQVGRVGRPSEESREGRS